MSSDAVEQIKARLSIVDVVETYVKLQKAGKNYKARSPFTNERTPSFFVSPDQGLYYCFSSGKGGDMFTFVQEMEGVDFRGALKILADRAGVELKKEDPAKRNERDAVMAALETATRFYEAQLPKQEKVIAYLKRRGMTGATAKIFRIGYAREEWSALYEYLVSKGFPAQIMEKAGLVARGDSGYYDRFRGRVMFPIANASGAVVAFSGRVFHVSGAPEDKTAKYVNSPETPVYNKSEILYGLDKAKQAIRKADACIFVEGQMDLVMSHQAGIENTVAVSGTALSSYHLGLIRRLTENLVFAFDADEAGVSAARRGIDLALGEGFEVRVVAVPKGKDPADSILEDTEGWKKAVAEAKHVIDFYLDHAAEKATDERALMNEIKTSVLPFIARLRRPLDQGRFVAKTAEILHISEGPVWDELKRVKQDAVRQESAPENGNTRPWGGARPRKETIEERVRGIVLWQSALVDPAIDIDVVLKRLQAILPDAQIRPSDDITPEERGRLVFEAEVFCSQARSIDRCVDDLLGNLEEEVLKERYILLRRRLSETEPGSDDEEMILKDIRDLQKEIESHRKEE